MNSLPLHPPDTAFSIFDLLDRWIIRLGHLEQRNYDAQRDQVQARIVFILQCAHIALWLLYGVLYAYLRAPLSVGICLLTGALPAFVGFLIVRNGCKLVYAATLTSVSTAFAIFLITYVTGGTDSPVASWFVALIVSASIQLGARKGIFLSLLVFAQLITIYLTAPLHQNVLYELPFEIGAVWYLYFNYILSALTASVIIMLFIHHFEEGYRHLQEAERLAIAAAESKTNFLANMSHEIRTPLNAIMGFSTLGKDEPDIEQLHEFMTIIDQSSAHLRNIIDDILDFSKLDSAMMTLEIAPLSLRDMFDELHDVMHLSASSKGLALSFTLDDAVPQTIHGDGMRLRQVLNNLISNAIKFSAEGTIRIHASLGPESDGSSQLHIAVQDQGIGITLEQQATLFQPFVQADNSTTRKYGGTGLGLSICKKIVDLMGGRIKLDSQPGDGSTFTLMLPLLDQDDAPLIAEPPADETNIAVSPDIPKLGRKHILLVEDQPANQRLARSLLNKAGLDVTLAENGQMAVDILTHHPAFDLILMDIQMPGMNGREATLILRNELGISTPVIALTAHALNEERQRCLDAGMNDILTKPIDVDSFYQMLERYLSPQKGVPL